MQQSEPGHDARREDPDEREAARPEAAGPGTRAPEKTARGEATGGEEDPRRAPFRVRKLHEEHDESGGH